MGLTESDTRAKLIDPAIHSRGWTEEHIRREETAGAVEIIAGKPCKKAKGWIDYVLRLKASADSQPVAIAIIEAKAEHLPPNLSRHRRFGRVPLCSGRLSTHRFSAADMAWRNRHIQILTGFLARGNS
jgi:type I restriction enzyme R subunit